VPLKPESMLSDLKTASFLLAFMLYSFYGHCQVSLDPDNSSDGFSDEYTDCSTYSIGNLRSEYVVADQAVYSPYV